MQFSSQPALGVCIITNQTQTPIFAKCLASISTADEILIIDNNSGADWKPLLSSYQNMRVIPYPTQITDFAAARTFGLKQMQSPWVLFLDSDEVLSQNGIVELRNLAKSPIAGAMLHRHDVFHDKQLTVGEGGNKQLLRFVRVQAATVRGAVHEVIKVDGYVCTAHCTITHYAHPSVQEFFESIASYAQTAASHTTSTKLQNLLELLFFPLGKFCHALLIQCVWRDGWRGITYAFMMSLHSLFVRIYRYEIISQK